MPRTIVVVPCYNEARRLNVRAFQEFGSHTRHAELLLVNDGSRDETLELLEKLHEANPRRFSFLHLAANGGKAEAVRQGLLLALRSGADYVGFWDADLATPLADIESFAAVLDRFPKIDVVLGARIPLLGRHIERKRLRAALGRIFARAASWALALRVYDTQCGAKLFRVTPELTASVAQPFLARWIFDVEMLARLQRGRAASGQRPLARAIYEFPLDAWRDVAGSNVRATDFIRAVGEMARLYWVYLRRGAHGLAPPVGGADGRASDRSDKRAA